MMSNQEVHFLEDAPPKDFAGSTLQIGEDRSFIEQGSINDSLNGKQGLSMIPWSGENGEDYFSYRSEIIKRAIEECSTEILSEEDGKLLGTWLLTEINIWDNEKERMVMLTSQFVLTVKYDFIALKTLEVKRVAIKNMDRIIIGDLEYPPHSLVPRLNGLVTGVSEVVKGCLVRPLQNRFTPTTCSGASDSNANPLALTNFLPRPRKMLGLRTMWNQGEPLAFAKKWNPFCSDIPWNTYTSHPLYWHKNKDEQENNIFSVEDFADTLAKAVEAIPCSVEHKPIVLENYVGLSSMIHNKNSLGFFKVRGKFSF